MSDKIKDLVSRITDSLSKMSEEECEALLVSQDKLIALNVDRIIDSAEEYARRKQDYVTKH